MTSKVALLDLIRRKDYEEEYATVMNALADRDWAIVERTMWSISTRVLLRKEAQTCLPEGAVRGTLQWIHEVKGHPSPEHWLNSFKKTFDTQVPEMSLKKMIEDLYNTCRECLTNKKKRPGDLGLIGPLPIPHMVNMLVNVDFIDRPRCETYDYALMIVDVLSLFCQDVPCRKIIDGEGVLKAILRHWIRFFQLTVNIHSDQDIRFTGE